MTKERKPYRVMRSKRGACSHETSWAIVARFPGVEDVELMGTTYLGSQGKELCLNIAAELNDAFEKGYISGAVGEANR